MGSRSASLSNKDGGDKISLIKSTGYAAQQVSISQLMDCYRDSVTNYRGAMFPIGIFRNKSTKLHPIKSGQ